METEIFVVIECGYEGIENLSYATTDSKLAVERTKSLRAEILAAKEHKKKVLEEFGDEEDENCHDAWTRMYLSGELDHKEHDLEYKDPDSICLQKWDGNKFSCACTELGCPGEKSWIM